MSADELDLADVWHRTLRDLDGTDLSPSERAFVGLGRLVAVVDSTALVEVPNDYTKSIIEHRVNDTVVRTLSAQIGREVRLAVAIDQSLDPLSPTDLGDGMRATPDHDGGYPPRRPDEDPFRIPASDEDHDDERYDGVRYNGARTERFHPDSSRDGERDSHRHSDRDGERHTDRVGNVIPITSRRDAEDSARTRLNPKYTFETFVAGSSNRFAHAAARGLEAPHPVSAGPLEVCAAQQPGQNVDLGTHVDHVAAREPIG